MVEELEGVDERLTRIKPAFQFKPDEAAIAADRRALILAEQQSGRLHAREQARRPDK